MTATVRSPGSTLKPFIYGMAFDGLLAHPASLVRDAPTRFDDYAPHNFDGGFNGDVTVRRALQASLNLPAVIVLQRLGPVAFAARFKEAGLPLAFNAGTTAPSLPMALGGVGMSLRDLVTAYAALANGGTVNPLFEQPGARPRAASGAAALMTPRVPMPSSTSWPTCRRRKAPHGAARSPTRRDVLSFSRWLGGRFRRQPGDRRLDGTAPTAEPAWAASAWRRPVFCLAYSTCSRPIRCLAEPWRRSSPDRRPPL